MTWESAAGAQWQEGETEGLWVYCCNTCGGEIVADETTGATTYTDDEWAAALPEAEKILQQWKDGEATEARFAELANNFSTAKGKVNNLVDLIVKGFTIEGMGSVDACVNTVSESWNCKTALYIRNGAWELLQDYYETLVG